MKPSFRSRVRALLVFAACGLAGGCSFLADEFTWLDRAAPKLTTAPDAAVPGDRPGS